MSVVELINFDNVVFKAYIFWGTLMVTKILLMGPLTAAIQRFRTKTFDNSEDALSKKDKTKTDDPDVECVRSVRRNDLENIIPFLAIGYYFVLTNPQAVLAINLFRVIGLARIVHTLVYALVVVPKPARDISFLVGLAATAFMAARVIMFCF